MHNHEPEGYVCPLCQIVNGVPTDKGPSEPAVITQTDFVTVFVAGKWWRSNPGHLIVVPNAHIENIYDLDSVRLQGEVMSAIREVSIVLKRYLEVEGVLVFQNNEPASDQEVWHCHFHVVPRYRGDNFHEQFHHTYWPDLKDRDRFANKIRENM